MRRWRRLVFWVIGVLLAGAASAVLAFNLYYRSDGYRRGTQRRLTEFFGLPTEVGRIRPSGLSTRILGDVRMYLPDRRAIIFSCPQVVWDARGTSLGAVLTIRDATLTLGAGEWQNEDYMRVLRASLAHNFRDLNIRQVVFESTRVLWHRKDLSFAAEQLTGDLLFDDAGTGRGQLACGVLNGVNVPESVRIEARIDPLAQELLPEVTLTVPRMPLTTLGLDRVLHTPVTRGSFAGRITLRQSAQLDEVELQGKAEDVLLAELTARTQGGPLPAVVDLAIEDGLIRGKTLVRLRFSGAVREMTVNPLLARFGLPELGGELRLTVYGGRVEDERLRHLRVSGEWTGGSAERLLEALLKRGGISGRLRVHLNDLLLEDDVVQRGEMDVLVEPAPGTIATVDRSLLLDLLRRWIGVSLPEQLLPATVQFVQIGARLQIAAGHAILTAAEGPVGRALITTQAFGQNVPLLQDVRVDIDLGPLMESLHQHAGELKRTVRERLRAMNVTRPAP